MAAASSLIKREREREARTYLPRWVNTSEGANWQTNGQAGVARNLPDQIEQLKMFAYLEEFFRRPLPNMSNPSVR